MAKIPNGVDQTKATTRSEWSKRGLAPRAILEFSQGSKLRRRLGKLSGCATVIELAALIS
jgi:hypothetical protein